MPVTTSPLSRSRPKTSAAYLTSSALYNAGFRGWPLVVMTALAGREARWNPTALNNNPNTGDYSVGLWQINYFGNLRQGRTAEYGSPQALLSNPQDQANAAYKLAGGNQLVGLQNWALTPSPKSGVVPVGSTSSVGQNTLAPFMPQAISAASEVGTFGPAPASQIAQASAWPGAGPLGNALNGTAAPGLTQYQTGKFGGKVYATSASCNQKGNAGGKMGVAFQFGPWGMTSCQLKAITGGLTLAAGGIIMVIGVASILVAGFGKKSAGAAAVAPVILVARAGGRGVRAVKPRKKISPQPASSETEEAA